MIGGGHPLLPEILGQTDPPSFKNSDFPSKTALLWKEVCCKVSLCENFQRQSCKAFTGVSIHSYSFIKVSGKPQQPEKADMQKNRKVKTKKMVKT